jgi:hypothetical protein
MTTIIPFRSWRRAQIVAPPFTLKEITTGIINPNRSKSSFNVFYSTFCSELNKCNRQEQTCVMGDGLREVQQHFQNIDAAAVDDAGFDDDAVAGLDIDDLLEAEAVDPDDIEEDLTDYFDIRVKRRMVRNKNKLNPYSFLFINLFLFLFVSVCFFSI